MTSISEISQPNNKENGIIINHTNSSSSPSIFSTPKWPSSRRTLSLSSSSISSNSSSSFRSILQDDEIFSLPNSPSTSFPQISSGGIPFSWETIPGIPKKQSLNKLDHHHSNNNSPKKVINSNNSNSKNYLPLPPAATGHSITNSKLSSNQKKHYITRRDPFFTALVECSKGGDAETGEEEDKDTFGGGVWKAKSLISTRFGFVNMSCKNSSSVAESLVLLPRGPRRIPYNVIKKSSV